MSDPHAAVRALGCLCCEMGPTLGYLPTGLRTEAHHMTTGGLAGQKRLGNAYVLPLCSWRHRSSFTEVAPPMGHKALIELDRKATIYGPGRAMHSRDFKRVYGTEAQLHQIVRDRLEESA